MKNIKIIVATHKKYKMPNDAMYLPVQVGAEGKETLGYVRDNEGENISHKNPNYCELTGLYWAWKNLDAEYLGLAHYRRHPEFEDIKEIMVFPHNFTLYDFVKKVGLEPQKIQFELFQLDDKQEYDENDFWNDLKIKNFYNSIKCEVIENSKNQYKWLFDYMEPFLKGKVIGIVDIGWKATMQSKFSELLKANPVYKDCSVHGFYLGVEKQTDDVDGFLYKSNQQTTFKTAIDAGYGVIETLFLAREGTVVKYSQEGPVQAEYEVKTEEEIRNLQDIHNGALEFIEKMKSFDLKDDILMNPQDVFCYFENLVYKPKKKDLRELGKIGFKDLNDAALINEKGLLKYMVSPKLFRKDYHNAPWKIGFLKKNVCRWFPWGRVYKKVKKIG